MTTKNRKSICSHIVIRIDPATEWIEICAAPPARADLVSNQVELAWLTRYQLPSKVIVDFGNEFLAESETIIQTGYVIQVIPLHKVWIIPVIGLKIKYFLNNI